MGPSGLRGWRRLAQISVVAVNPVLPRRVENIERNRVFEDENLVGSVRCDAENLPGADDLFAPIDDEPERAFRDVADLLVKVAVLGHMGAFLQHNPGEHHVGANQILPRDERIHGLGWNLSPAVQFRFSHNALQFATENPLQQILDAAARAQISLL